MTIPQNPDRGFTFLELLVVVAVIGILVAIASTSYVATRNRGDDAGVRAELSVVQARAEVYFTQVGKDSYGSPFAAGPCSSSLNTLFSDNAVWAAITRARSNAGGGEAYCYISTDGSMYAVEVPLKSNTSTYVCVDPTGTSLTTTVQFSAATTRCGT